MPAGYGRQRAASLIRVASRASTGTSRVASDAVSADRYEILRKSRSSASGSTATDISQRATMITTTRIPASAPATVASSVMSMRRPSTSPPRTSSVLPSW